MTFVYFYVVILHSFQMFNLPNTADCEIRRIFLSNKKMKMKAEVLNTINSFTIKVDMEGVTKNQVCQFADLINKIQGFQTTEIIFIYSGKESFIKVYSESRTANELEEEMKKLGL